MHDPLPGISIAAGRVVNVEALGRAAHAPRAAVQFVDASGEPLAVDARQLFGIKAGDTVVVRGNGELVPDLDLLVVTADGLYVRRSAGGH